MKIVGRCYESNFNPLVVYVFHQMCNCLHTFKKNSKNIADAKWFSYETVLFQSTSFYDYIEIIIIQYDTIYHIM